MRGQQRNHQDGDSRDRILLALRRGCQQYIDGDTGAGLGTSHQTGWTTLMAKPIQQYAEYTLQDRQHEAGPAFGEWS